MKNARLRFGLAVVLGTALLLSLSACTKQKPPESSEPTVQPTEQTYATISAEDAPWQEALSDKLLETYGVLPEYYEDLGDGTCRVYVEVGGEMMAFAVFNTVTGDYQLISTEGN